MKIKRLKKLNVNANTFDIVWDKETSGASFSYLDGKITIGLKNNKSSHIFMLLCHELMEIVALECSVRLTRPDVYDDYIFVYDHRQHDTMMQIFSGLLSQFIN